MSSISCYSQSLDVDSSTKDEKIISFGVIADVQYADIDMKGRRDYRNSLGKLEIAVEELNREELDFSINLGDLIDRDFESYEKPLQILSKLNSPLHSAIGNHDFSVDSRYINRVRKLQGNRRGYFDFTIENFTFIVVDGSDLSLFGNREGSKEYLAAERELKELKAEGANNGYDWNGGVGSKQFKWIKGRLDRAKKDNRRVVLFAHWPLTPENGTQLWSSGEMLSLIGSYSNVVAWISGHHHAGGYHKPGSIHHLTMDGMVETVKDSSFGVVDVYRDRLVLRGYGGQSSRVMAIE